VAVALALLVQAYVVKPYRIPSSSMAVSLRPGDRVLVNRVVYHLREPRRGDVIVFHAPDDGQVLVKRVVGLPGETLSTRDGRLLVDGKLLDEPYVRVRRGDPEPTRPGPIISGTTMHRPYSLDRPYRVPAATVYVLGDNRTHSGDSRVWGPVALDRLIGEALLVYWPLSHAGGL
jgi:signal peptidase I